MLLYIYSSLALIRSSKGTGKMVRITESRIKKAYFDCIEKFTHGQGLNNTHCFVFSHIFEESQISKKITDFLLLFRLQRVLIELLGYEIE